MTTPPPFPANIEPLDGEQVRSRRLANRTQHKLRAVGGRLYVTNQRVIFYPNAVDSALSGQYWWAYLDAIIDVGKQQKDLRAFYSGGLRTRLKIALQDGTTELFVVNKLDDVIEEIRSARGT